MLKSFLLFPILAALASARYLELGTGLLPGSPPAQGRGPFSIYGVDGSRWGLNFNSNADGSFTLVSTSETPDAGSGSWGAGSGSFDFKLNSGATKSCHIEALPGFQVGGSLLRWTLYPEDNHYITIKMDDAGVRVHSTCAEREADGYRLVCGDMQCRDA